MIHHDVIVAQSDCVVAEHLATQLHSYFRNISVARDLEEVRHIIYRHGAGVVILDLDLAGYGELRALTSEFRTVGFVCTHRLPDEEMWREVLSAGGIDCCPNDDIHQIVRASRRLRSAFHAAA
jgi:response regulator of citrate/malate metabolism